MDMISNTADTQRFCVQVTADRRNVGLHARPDVPVQPCCAILGAEDNVNDDLDERLRHCGMMAERDAQVNRAFSASGSFFTRSLGRCPRLRLKATPTALNPK